MKLNNFTLDLMEKFTLAVGVSGNEKAITQMLKTHYEKYTDEIIYDNLGSIFAVKKSKNPKGKKVFIASHLDELGFIVNGITNNGFLKILELGSLKKEYLLNQRVKIVNINNEEYKGVIVNSKGPKKDICEIKEMIVDIGCSNKKEVSDLGIKLGDSVIIDGDFEVIGNGNRVMAKALSSRYGCIMGLEILEALKDKELDFDLYIGATVQNKVGFRGIMTSTNLVEPDIAIILEVLEAGDVQGEEDTTGKLGDGVLACYYDKSMMPNRALLNYLVDVCKENNIKYQYYYSMESSDAGWVHKLSEGCPTLKGSIAGRNINTASTIIDVEDYLESKEALLKVLYKLSNDDIEEFKAENR